MKLQLIFDEKPRGGGGIGASAQIAKTLHQQGIDTTILLYDEALELATGGDFNSASERLQMLLCLNPGDGGSHFLLAKTLAAMKEWQKSILHLKKAAENGMKIPKEVRTFVDQGLQRELRNTDIERKRALQRDRTELNQLKNEIRRLRSKNSSLNNENLGLVNSLRTWMYACAIIAGSFAAIFIYMLIDGGETEEEQSETSTATTESDDSQEPTENTEISTPPTTDSKTKTRKTSVRKPATTIKTVKKPITKEPAGYDFPVQHLVQRDDTCGGLAVKYYKKFGLWTKIANHNNNPKCILRPGKSIEIPAPN